MDNTVWRRYGLLAAGAAAAILGLGLPCAAAENRPGGLWWRAEPPLGPLEKGAYLGVSAVPVEDALGSQLGLPAGIGLRVEYVDPDSPAHGKLQRHDVLHKLGDQLLVNQHQLAALIRSHRPGDTVELTILRGGKPQTVSVTLAEKELPPVPSYGLGWPDGRASPPLFPLPRFWVEKDREGPAEPGKAPSGEDMLRKIAEALRKSAALSAEQIERLVEDLRRRLLETQEPPPPPQALAPAPVPPPPPGAQDSLSVSVAISTASGGDTVTVRSVTIDRRTATLSRTRDGSRLVITDGDKGTVFDGPVDTEEQRRTVPDAYRDLFEKLGQLQPVTPGDPGSGVSLPPAAVPAPTVY